MTPEEIKDAKEYGVEIAKYLDQKRALKDISFNQMSKDTGIAQTQLQRFFSGKSSIGYENFIRIVRYLGLGIEITNGGSMDICKKDAGVNAVKTRTDEKKIKSMYGEDIGEFDNHLQYAYENLGNAVVETAVDDYRELRKKKKDKDRINGNVVTIAEIEKFFLSNRFNKFTNIDGGYLLNVLRKE